MSSPVTDAAVELVLGPFDDLLSAKSSELVVAAFVDCLACGLAGAATPEAGIVRDWVASLASRGDATVLGTNRTAPAALAALANGTAAHALDLDDFSSTMMHPSVCLIPALLAVGERQHAPGHSVALAYVAGFELFARLCRRMNPEHYARGWHATSTVGTLAAAAAVSRLLGLGPTETATAIGIAASNTGGLRDNFGTMVKPLHAGNAAAHGVAAAELASRGFTASTGILDGERGYAAVLGGDGARPLTPDLFATDHLELERSGLVLKRFACCGTIHSALDALLAIRDSHGLVAADVARVECRVNAWTPQIVIHRTASTPAEARFCLEYSLAVALVDGDAGIPQYTVDRLTDPVVQELSRRVHMYADDELTAYADEDATMHYASFPSVVTVETFDGRRISERVDLARGTSAEPFSTAEVDRKFLACAAGYDRSGAEALLLRSRELWAVDDVAAVAAAARLRAAD